MPVRLDDTLSEMKAVLTTAPQIEAQEKSDKILTLAAEFLVTTLARDVDRGRVAILMIVPDSTNLTFVYPKHLAQGNALPIDRNSLAGRTLSRRTVLVENNVPEQPHKEFYERIPDPDGTVHKIQKMVSSPLIAPDGRAIGVIEVSRTGTSPADAGGDFTAADADHLFKTCRVFAPYIAQTWTGARPPV